MSSEAPSFAAPSPEELAALFPGYTIHSLIACGGMGAVYFATQNALDRQVAIKILPREFSSDENFREGFAAEAKAMAKLNHPNLIGVYDFGEVDGMLYIIMEYVSGQSLYHAAYKKAIDGREAARIMAEVSSGIAHAHEHRILHRDIKPANILLDGHNRPKIGDFGLARPVGLISKEGEEIYGTPHYTAPEVVNAPSRVDTRADVFSLGVVLHELLTGKLPAEDPRLPSAISGSSPKLDAIVKKCTQPDPVLRYTSAAEIAADLTKFLNNSATPGPAGMVRPGRGAPPAPKRRAPSSVVRPVAKQSSGAGGIIAFLLLIGIAAGAYFFLKDQKPKPLSDQDEQSATHAEKTANPAANSTSATKTEQKPQTATPKNNRGSSPFGSTSYSQGTSSPFGSTAPPVSRPAGPAPIFDVDSFLDRARGIMRDKASSELASYKKATEDIADKLDKALSREVRSVDRGQRDDAKNDLKRVMAEIRNSGNYIPMSVSIRGADDGDIRKALQDAREAQSKNEGRLISSLKPHAATYIHGIELQIERLPENDIGALRMLNDEIADTKQNEGHFASILSR
ncbi:protein kinase [Luteolibacter pohnpeiensis]|uniref:Protein kinase n=1 Tax=Luteolibacter pohnpeiensis TaxID=454153 RepID=A0A934S5U7_9BACT|nr:serine/threonine-protein kinase [Luteolibacter pohnpeiensis]MBK1881820.1 protein kinase [Luteolibacter pohnpeiensis]